MGDRIRARKSELKNKYDMIAQDHRSDIMYDKMSNLPWRSMGREVAETCE